jgi:hypothetical protein
MRGESPKEEMNTQPELFPFAPNTPVNFRIPLGKGIGLVKGYTKLSGCWVIFIEVIERSWGLGESVENPENFFPVIAILYVHNADGWSVTCQ